MSGAVILLMVTGLAAFGAGAYLSATGGRELGIALMGVGLLFQVLTLRQMRIARKARARGGQSHGDG